MLIFANSSFANDESTISSSPTINNAAVVDIQAQDDIDENEKSIDADVGMARGEFEGGGPGGGGSTSTPIPELNTLAWEGVPERLEAYDFGLLGDKIDFATGSLTFSQTDISIPGNSSLEVAVRRKTAGRALQAESSGFFADWQMDVPYISMTMPKYNLGGNTLFTWPNRCTHSNSKPAWSSPLWQTKEYWDGMNVSLPNQGSQRVLDGPNTTIFGSNTARKSTTSHLKFECINNIGAANGGGEGFTVKTTDGTSYRFDVLHYLNAGSVVKGTTQLHRRVGILYASKVTDKNGNWVEYHYNTAKRLTHISSNDGRLITFAYNAQGNISSASTNGRTWTYTYGATSGGGIDNSRTLTKVTRPDSKFWSFSFGNWRTKVLPGHCARQPFSISLTHPYGTQGTFNIAEIRLGKSGVENTLKSQNARNALSGCYEDYIYHILPWFEVLAVTQKQLTASSVPTSTWTYYYQSDDGNFNTTEGPADFRSTTVTEPLGGKTTYVHNRRWGPKNGQLTRVIKRAPNNVVLQETINTYLIHDDLFGGIPLNPLLGDYAAQESVSYPLSTVILQGGDTYTTTNIYNTAPTSSAYSFGNPTRVTRTSSLHSDSRVSDYTYSHLKSNWIVGLMTSHELNNQPFATYTYDPLGRKTQENRFNRLFAKFGYHTTSAYKGRLHWIENALGDRHYALNWKRGRPQQIMRPDNKSTLQTVDNNGWVTKTTDAMLYCTNYGYNSMGRITLIDPCDSRWLNTSISYATTSGNEGLSYVSSGMVKQTTTRGNYQSIAYHDNLLRPVMNKEMDTSIASTARFTRTRYNALGQADFQSLPSGSSSTPYGSFTSYDALGRPTIVNDNTRAGNVSYSYLSNNRVSMNDNKGNVTTTTYRAYGAPEQKITSLIASPEGVTTTMGYNIFDNPVSIAQGGITEYRVYDTYQQLCKVVRPDIGRTAYDYDNAGQIAWKASGSSVSTSTTVCDISVNAQDKATFTFDNLGNIETITFADSSPDKSFNYDDNNRLMTLTAGGVVTAYEYNSANLIEKETMTVDGQSFILEYVYNGNEHLTNTIYPSTANISYAPNALGQARQAGTHASNATYHPNGMVKTHSYFNDHAHTSTQNTSGLPITFYDRLDTTPTYALNHGFTYDANNNVTFLDDKVNSAYDLRFTFDGLDRLNNITDSFLGTGDVNYDTMGNITYYKLGSQTINYQYNSNKQLMSTSGSKNYSFIYDDKGNVTDNGTRGFTYNTANQMVNSDGYLYTYDGNNKRVKEQGSNSTPSYSFYGSNGKLMYRNVNGQDHDYYYLGNKLVANKKGNTVTYLHSDYLGSPAAESNSSGTVMSRMYYQPFGEKIGTPKDDVGYTGHKFDTDLGLNYMEARYYDPVIGRFYSNDPMSAIAHLSKGNVHGFGRYTYANNNPFKYIDPDGKEGVGVRQDIRAKAFFNGDITTQEFKDQTQAEAVGGLIGIAVVATRGAAAAPITKKVVQKIATEIKDEVKQEVAAQVIAAAIEIGANATGVDGTMSSQNDGQLNGNRSRSENSSQSIKPEEKPKKAPIIIRPKKLGR